MTPDLAEEPEVTLPPGVIGYSVADVSRKPPVLTHASPMPADEAARELDAWRRDGTKTGATYVLCEVRVTAG